MAENRETEFSQVIILGAGAIGSLYGALLSKKINVLLVGRGSHAETVSLKGLKISGRLNGRFELKVSKRLNDLLKKALILLTTKAQDSESAVMGVKSKLDPSTAILLLQNGLGNEERVRALVDERVKVARGLVASGVELLTPGEIEVKLLGETVVEESPLGERIKSLFDQCGLETHLSDRIDVEIWKKLVLNCVINPLTAIFNVPNNMIAMESLEKIRDRIVEECINVARCEGVILDSSLKEEVSNMAARYSNISSMCQDIIKGKKTEIDFLNGKIVELGRTHGVETTVNEVMASLIRFQEGRRRNLKS